MNHSDKPYTGKADPRADTKQHLDPVSALSPTAPQPVLDALAVLDEYARVAGAGHHVQLKKLEDVNQEYRTKIGELQSELSILEKTVVDYRSKLSALKDSCREIVELIKLNF